MALSVTVNNTGNSVPSDNYRDWQDNVLFFDAIINSTENSVLDRLGIERTTLAKAISDIVNGGQDAIDDFNQRAQEALNSVQEALEEQLGNQLSAVPWVQGQIATTQRRYIFQGNPYVAPDASESNPITLGATPVGDNNWILWSYPIRFFRYEEVTVAQKTVFNVGQPFEELGKVFLNNSVQASTGVYTVQPAFGTITFNRPIPLGTYVSIDVGRSTDILAQQLEDIVDRAEEFRDQAEGFSNSASSSATAAEAARQATEQLFDQFGDQYLGPHASDPTTDNDGDPLTEGDVYYNTVENHLRFYNGASWTSPEDIATTAATNAQNSANQAASARDDAQSARDDSQAARDASQLARDQSITARDSSQVARDESVTARNQAQGFANDAAQSAIDAQNAVGNIPNATTNQRGIAEIATLEEVETGTSTERIVSPFTFSTRLNAILAEYVRASADNTFTGSNTFRTTTPIALSLESNSADDRAAIFFSDSDSSNQNGEFYFTRINDSSERGGASFHFSSTETITTVIIDGDSDYYAGSNKVFHAGDIASVAEVGAGVSNDKIITPDALEEVLSGSDDSELLFRIQEIALEQVEGNTIAGAVGTPILARVNNVSAPRGFGTTISGSDLTPCNANGTTPGTITPLAGTWVCMGSSVAASGAIQDPDNVSLWVRQV